jgi:hypothetical protein
LEEIWREWWSLDIDVRKYESEVNIKEPLTIGGFSENIVRRKFEG